VFSILNCLPFIAVRFNERIKDKMLIGGLENSKVKSQISKPQLKTQKLFLLLLAGGSNI